MAPPADVIKKAKLKLQQFRDHPPGSADVSDADLTLLVTVLIQDDVSKDDIPHWFCSKAHPVAVDAATFLFRLHAYQSPRVEKWRTQLRRCITNCAKCVQQFQEAKTTARHTQVISFDYLCDVNHFSLIRYFVAFADATVTNFFKSIVEWELQIILDALLPADGPSNPTPCSASMYHLCSNPVIQKSPKFSQIEQILESHPPQEPYSDWPTDVPPPGLFLLMMSSSPTLSTWASRQLHTYQTTPIPVEHFAPIYVETLQETTNQVASTEQTVSDETALWTSYSNILRYVPPPFLKPSASFGTDIRRIVLSHLSDVGNRRSCL
jgi:senataxin